MELSAIYRYLKKSKGICTDTRKIEKGSIYVALKGENFNGNDFVQQAFDSGASFAIIDEAQANINENCLLVEDTLKCLQELAQYHRSRFSLPVIGLTGSNGKTTTKELIVKVLKRKFNVHFTIGNLNNHIGVPLTLLELDKNSDISIVEMGANHQGEIELLSELCDPDYGLITNVGKAHLEGFGGVAGVIKGKTELYQHIAKQGRLLFVNEQDPVLLDKSESIPRILYGPQKNNLELIDETPLLKIKWKNHIINTQLTGKYNFQNIQAAIAIGGYFRVSDEDIVAAIEQYSPDNSRSQLLQAGTNQIILDSYNANPSSVKAALDNLMTYKSSHKKKVAILGDMLELGDESDALHAEVVRQLAECGFDKVILVGKDFSFAEKSEQFKVFKDSAEAADFIRANPIQDSVVLIKGSRGIRMERVLTAIQ